MGISSSGLVSGLRVDDILSQLMTVERKPIDLLQSRQARLETQIASLLSANGRLSSLQSALSALNDAARFNTKTASVTKTSSGADLVSATASSSAVAGSFDIQVLQLAQAQKVASQGFVDQNTTAVASGGGTFKFKMGSSGAETSIALSSTMTLQGLRDAINAANAGVTASILNDGTPTNPYRLILTANNPGAANALQITQNPTALDFANKRVEAASAATTNTYAGTVASNEGANYTGTTNKTFLVKVVAGGDPASGAAKFKYSIDGGINWLGAGGAAYTGSNGVTVAADDALQNIDGNADGATTTEGAKIKFAGGTLAVDDTFRIDVFNPTLQLAQDAVVKIDSLTLTKSTNTITDAIQGVTLNLLKADSTNSVTLTVSSDSSGAKGNIQKFVDAYNDLNSYLNGQLGYDPKTKKSGPLQGDAALLEIQRRVRDMVSGEIPGLPSSGVTNLSQVGINSDSKSGKLTIDDSKLSSALSSKPFEVMRLFVGVGSPSDPAIAFVSKTSKTQPGMYGVSITTAPEQAVVTGDQAIQASGLGSAELLTFQVFTHATDPNASATSFNVNLSAGSTISQVVDTLNSSFATQGVKLSASNDSGKLKITSADYGADLKVTVTSNVASSSASTGIGTTSQTDQGVDIAGTLNGHRAEGKGNVLTGIAGFAEEGLKISTTSNQTGNKGTVAVSLGVADRLSGALEAYTNGTTGVLTSRQSRMEKQVEELDKQISQKEEALTRKEKGLREEFTRLESILSQYQSQSQFLTSQLARLDQINRG